MSLANLIFSLVKALAASEDYQLNMVLTDSYNVVVFEREVKLEGYRKSDVLYMIKEMKTIGDEDEKV